MELKSHLPLFISNLIASLIAGDLLRQVTGMRDANGGEACGLELEHGGGLCVHGGGPRGQGPVCPYDAGVPARRTGARRRLTAPYLFPRTVSEFGQSVTGMKNEHVIHKSAMPIMNYRIKLLVTIHPLVHLPATVSN